MRTERIITRNIALKIGEGMAAGSRLHKAGFDMGFEAGRAYERKLIAAEQAVAKSPLDKDQSYYGDEETLG